MSYNKHVVARGPVIASAFTGGTTGGEIVAAVTGKKLRLISMMLLTDTAGNVTVRDNTGTPIKFVGPAPVAANGGFVLPHSPEGWGDTGSGKNINVLLGTSCTTFGGVVTYQVLDGN